MENGNNIGIWELLLPADQDDSILFDIPIIYNVETRYVFVFETRPYLRASLIATMLGPRLFSDISQLWLDFFMTVL